MELGKQQFWTTGTWRYNTPIHANARASSRVSPYCPNQLWRRTLRRCYRYHYSSSFSFFPFFYCNYNSDHKTMNVVSFDLELTYYSFFFVLLSSFPFFSFLFFIPLPLPLPSFLQTARKCGHGGMVNKDAWDMAMSICGLHLRVYASGTILTKLNNLTIPTTLTIPTNSTKTTATTTTATTAKHTSMQDYPVQHIGWSSPFGTKRRKKTEEELEEVRA